MKSAIRDTMDSEAFLQAVEIAMERHKMSQKDALDMFDMHLSSRIAIFEERVYGVKFMLRAAYYFDIDIHKYILPQERWVA
jgi:hypothetical protein